MKKVFTLGLLAMFSLSSVQVFAQEEEDVTSYIANPGFDEDLTFDATGKWKDAVKKEAGNDRCEWWIAADSTVYAHTVASSTQRRPDGRKEEAVNGFIARIQGWTIETNKTFPACDWVYFGSVPYALADQAIPVADDGTTYLEVPAKPDADNGDDNVGFVYLRAGWGGRAVYKQTVKLPCAQYRLEYWAINLNPSGQNGTNLSKVTCRRDVWEDATGFSNTEWTKHIIEFTPTSDFTMEFGFESSGGSGSNPFLCIDGIRLYRTGDADEVELLKSDLYDLTDDIDQFISDNNLSDFGIYFEWDEVIRAEANNARTVEDLRAAIEKLKAYQAKLEAIVPLVEEYNILVEEIENLKETTSYPGFDTFDTATKAQMIIIANEVTADDFEAAIEKLRTLINEYYFSQEVSADNPADYSFLIKSRYFTKTSAVPTITFDGDGYVESVEYPNEFDYTVGSAPEDATSAGWETMYGFTGGDQRLNFVQQRVCWNAWQNSGSNIGIQQVLTGIPNGFYTISAEMNTQPGCITDQHVFGTSALQTANSPVLENCNFDESDPTAAVWDYLTTEKVLVTNGRLVVGACGSGDPDYTDTDFGGEKGDHRRGWFLVTNFALKYYGAEGADEAAQQLYVDKLAAANDMAESMKFAADKAAYQAAIEAASGATTLDEMNEVMTALDEATATAQASIDRYNGVINGSYKSLREGDYTANQQAVANKACDIMDGYINAPDATYTKMDSLTTILREYYLNGYIPVLGEAEELDIKDATVKAAVNATIGEQVAALTAITIFPTKEEMDAYTAQLRAAIAAVTVGNLIALGENDFTSLIVNATCDNTTGWTVNKPVGDGNGVKTSQQYDGDSAGGYIDTYNSTAGAVRATISQVISNIPNGLYEVKAMTRASGTPGAEGVYLFGINGTDSINAVFAPAHIVGTPGKYIDFFKTDVLTEEELADFTEETVYYFTDKFGQIWMNEADKEGENPGSGDAGVLDANNGMGRGWFYTSFQVNVTENTLTLGVTCDSVFTQGHLDTAGAACVPFSGTWFSADNFTLTLLENRQPDFSPVTGIAAIEQRIQGIEPEYYSIDGRRVRNLNNAGIYIIRQNGATRKVMVK